MELSRMFSMRVCGKQIFAAIAAILMLGMMIGGVQGMPPYTSTLAGVVVGADGKPVANASVTYQTGGGDAPHVIRTDARGHFSVGKLRADSYDLRATTKGMYSEWARNVSVRPGQTKTITLRLTIAAPAAVAAAPKS
jgi:Carboxypeptidase regulatory-like domain